MATDQEDHLNLYFHIAACREHKPVISVLSCDLIGHFIEIVDVYERTRHDALILSTDITIVFQRGGHRNHDVLNLQRMVCHLLGLSLIVECNIKARMSTQKGGLG